VNLAFILLSAPALPKGDEVVRDFASFASEGQRLRQQEIDTKKPSKIEVMEFELTPGGTAFVAAMPMPVLNGEADAGARFSLSSYATGWTLPPHKAHLIVTLRGAADPSSKVATLSSFTSFLAAVAQASPAVGVYWAQAGATHDAEFFISTARDRGIVPRITLWTGLSIVGEEGGRLSLLSHGMQQLDLPDLLLVAPKSAARDALEAFFDLLSYVAERGEQVSPRAILSVGPRRSGCAFTTSHHRSTQARKCGVSNSSELPFALCSQAA
jgi:hypothetical protein